MLNTPFPPWPSFTEEEVDCTKRVLLSNRVNYWTGDECRKFEKEFAEWVGCEYAIALANGTVALELALKALGIGHGDEVVVTPRTFIASVACIVNIGARPIFADVDPDTQNITADSVQPVLTSRTRAMICVHLAGMPCEMDAIMDLAQEKGIFVIEDCAQAHGARYKGRSVGSIGHIGTWSFCQDKIMSTAGEGGMLTTNRIEWWQKVWSLKDHGRTSETLGELTPSTSFKWLYHMFGTNGRMLEIQAAIGRVQLGRMAAWHSIRLRHANKIRSTALQLTIFRVPKIPDHIEHAWYKCYLFVRNEMLKPGWNRDRVIDAIKQRGVPCYSGICPEVYLEEAFENTGFRPSQRLSVAEELGNTSMMLLVHPTLTDAEINKTCQALSEVAILATIENAFVKTRPTRLNR